MTTKIEWCMNPDGTPGEVWNPVTGCAKISAGCKHCYAERIAARFWGERKFTDVLTHADRLDIPFHWKKPRRVFVNSMSDLFHKDVPDSFLPEVFAAMTIAQQHTFMILTKRPDRMAEVLQDGIFTEAVGEAIEAIAGRLNPCIAHRADEILDGDHWPLPNVWLGVSAEDQKTADERIPYLLQTPAAVRFVSCEPLLGPVQMSPQWMYNDHGWETLDWVIAGGESGPGARPMHPQWAKSIKDQCQAADVPFFFKQWGEWVPRGMAQLLGFDAKATTNTAFDAIPYPVIMSRIGKKNAGRLLDGRTWNEFPKA
jgi:protein gp37